MRIKVLILLLLVYTFTLNAQNDDNKSSSSEVNTTIELDAKDVQELQNLSYRLDDLKKDENLDNEWTKTYSAYISHKYLIDRRDAIKNRLKLYKSYKSLTLKQKKNSQRLQKELKVLEDKINLVKDFEKEPFQKIISPPVLSDAPKITNPIAIISGFSYIKELKNRKNKYIDRFKSLEATINKLKKEEEILSKMYAISGSSIDKQHLNAISDEIKQLYTIKDIFKTTKEIYLKKADEVEIAIKKDIKREFQKALYIGIVALFFLSIFIGLKYLTRKYLSDKDSYYTINKAINIIFISIIIITLLFAYLENVSYLITILGFASAGIAIAMKDWFMSLLGWFVIMIGGSVHVGDRIKIVRGNTEYVGDIVDISLLRITIQEDITLTTYMLNRRAGRIIFVPNNYIFTDMIANYSHSGLKTVWDGIDFYITFDSNSTKAMNIAKNIAKQYSKGYTDITRKQLNRLRSKYQLKSTNVEPRVFSFIEGYGMKISVWYLTNAYATLTLRSTISTKIIDEIQKEVDIEIAYPTQSLMVNSAIPKPEILEKEPKEI
jgi:small-conductance mechanosensitive channel